MKIVTYNLNGIRASTKNGLYDWLSTADVDIFCFQETRASEEQIMNCLTGLWNYDLYTNIAEKAGYSGTAILTKQKPICERFDFFPSIKNIHEGRIIVLEYEKFFLIDFYAPNGSRLEFKMNYMKNFLQDFENMQKKVNKPIIICTDFNISHTEKDVSNPKECAKRTGFLKEERELFDEYEKAGLIDSARLTHKDDQLFTWSSYTAKYNQNTKGWLYRFDYIFLTSPLDKAVKSCETLLEKTYSDHYPVMLELEI